MSDTGFFSSGVCHPSLDQAKAALCDSFNQSIALADGTPAVQLCMHLNAQNFALNTYRTGIGSGTSFVNQIVPPYPLFASCSLEQPELFPLPSATDIGTVFAWGFSLVLVSYLTAWGLGTVLNFLKRN